MTVGPEYRREAYIAAGREEFFERGYARATMSSVARAVGGSKTSLWRCFSSKESLFAAVADDIIKSHTEAATIELSPDKPVDAVLRQFGEVLGAALVAEPMLNLYRLVVSEAAQFPHLAQLYYANGPKRGKALLAEWMSMKMESGELRLGDPHEAARQFAALCQASTHQLAILGLLTTGWEKGLAKDVDAAVRTFVRAWENAAPIAKAISSHQVT